MTPSTKGGVEFNPAAVELLEWKAQRALGAPVPKAPPQGGDAEWRLAGFDPAGHWLRWLRDAHPPRFRAPGGVDVMLVSGDESVPAAGPGPTSTPSFGATAAFGLGLPASTEGAFAALPGTPGWRCYTTHAGGAPAAAATYVDGPVVLLAADATAEVGRRSPARMALLHRVIADAVESGARLIAARTDERAEGSGAAAGLLLAGFEKSYLCPAWVDAGLPAS